MGNQKQSDASSKSVPESKSKEIVLAGAFAAFTVDLLIYPLDTVKTRIQSREYKKVYAGKANRAALWRGLYQGVGAVVVATVPSSAAFFTTYEFTKSHFQNSFLCFLPDPAIHSLASSISELVSCAILTPSEVLKQQAQTLRSAPKTISFGSNNAILAGVAAESASLQALTKFKSHPRDLFQGYFALAGRNLPFTALQFPLYEYLKKRFSEGLSIKDDISKTIQVTSMAGGIAATVAAAVTTPVDLIKTRVMLAASSNKERKEMEKGRMGTGIKSEGKAPPGVYKTVVAEILREDGFKGLWRGLVLRSLWSGFGLAIYLGAYEGGKVYLRQDRQTEEASL